MCLDFTLPRKARNLKTSAYETALRSPIASGSDPSRGTVAACLRGLQRTSARGSPVPIADRARGLARADAGAADRGGRGLSSAWQPRRGAGSAGLCLPVGRDNRGAGGTDRTCAGGAARSDQPARVGDPGRGTPADCGARGGARRSDRAGRRRPGARRRAAARSNRPVGGRIPSDGRGRSGAQESGNTRSRNVVRAARICPWCFRAV